MEPARRFREIEIRGKRLADLDLTCLNMRKNSGDAEKSEYVALVKWIKAVPRNEARWKPNAGLYTTTHVRASLDKQPETIDFLEREFGLDIRALVV